MYTQHERSQATVPPMAMHSATTPCVVRAEGCYLYTEDNRKIIDMASGIAVNALGHCHPKIVAAIEKQAHTLIHAGHNVLYYEPYVTLTEKLIEKTGNKYKLYFSNSGAEANEGAMKLAKYYTHRPVIISMKNAFHGRTMATATITTSNAGYRKYYGKEARTSEVIHSGQGRTRLRGGKGTVEIQKDPIPRAAKTRGKIQHHVRAGESDSG